MNLKAEDFKILTIRELIDIIEEDYDQYSSKIIEKVKEELNKRGKKFVEKRIKTEIKCPECGAIMEHGWIYTKYGFEWTSFIGINFRNCVFKSRVNKEKKDKVVVSCNDEGIPGLLCNNCGLVQFHLKSETN